MSRNTSEERLVPSTVQPPRWGDATTFRNPPRGLATLKLNPVGGAVGVNIRGAEGRAVDALAARDASRPIIGHPPIAMGLEAWMANNLSHAPMQSTPLPSKAGDDWAFPPMELQLLSMVRNTIVPSAAIAASLKTTAEGNLLESGIREYSLNVSGVTFNAIKRREAQSRLAALKRSERSAAAADAQQERASLVGDSSKWRITNLKAAAKAMASWQ